MAGSSYILNGHIDGNQLFKYLSGITGESTHFVCLPNGIELPTVLKVIRDQRIITKRKGSYMLTNTRIRVVSLRLRRSDQF